MITLGRLVPPFDQLRLPFGQLVVFQVALLEIKALQSFALWLRLLVSLARGPWPGLIYFGLFTASCQAWCTAGHPFVGRLS